MAQRAHHVHHAHRAARALMFEQASARLTRAVVALHARARARRAGVRTVARWAEVSTVAQGRAGQRWHAHIEITIQKPVHSSGVSRVVRSGEMRTF
jgi:hypothetical protein